MKKVKQALMLFLAFIVLSMTGCSSSQEKPQGSDSLSSVNSSSTADDVPSTEPSEIESEKESDVCISENDTESDVSTLENDTEPDVSTPENDTDIGLKNIKIDSSERDLTDEQKAVVQYFDNDYLTVGSYEFLRRYPNIFQNAQVSVTGMVTKILSMDNEEYKIVLWINTDRVYAPYATPGEYLIINGKTNPKVWFMEEDALCIDGRYTGVETIEIDGTSYTIPTIDAYNANFKVGRYQSSLAEKFDHKFIKTVAETIFGKDIEIRDPVAGEDLSMEDAITGNYYLGGGAYEGMEPSDIASYMDLVVELEDQSNANFKKFRFSKFEGEIIDAKGPFDSGIERCIEFSADFEHFFLFTHNENLESLTLAYYDKSFKKLWEREFEETTNAIYDYTENNLYIIVNNELFIINIKTGEDTFQPTYVGDKKEIRKYTDGIVMVSASKSDGIIKSSLNGDILWKTNLSADVNRVGGVQFVDGNIILSYCDDDWNSHYTLINWDSGEMLIDTEG